MYAFYTLSLGSKILSFFKMIINLIKSTIENTFTLLSFTDDALELVPSLVSFSPWIVGTMITMVVSIALIKLILGR